MLGQGTLWTTGQWIQQPRLTNIPSVFIKALAIIVLLMGLPPSHWEMRSLVL